MPRCKACNKSRVATGGIVAGLCSLCLSILEEEATRRGFELTAKPQPGEPDTRILLNVRLSYWRDRWRAGA